jgi:hypothetical protein
MQLYTRLYDYIYDYQKLIYDYYSKTATAFLVTYYHLDLHETIWDSTKLTGGYYEKIGTLSGVKWNKILLLPVFFIENLSGELSGEDIGLVNQKETSIVIPSTYNFRPHFNDIIKLDQTYLQPNREKDVYALYVVSGIERGTTPLPRSFYRLKTVTEQSRTTTEIDQQVSNTYSFFEYTKFIYTVPDTIFLARMMLKNQVLKARLNNMFDQNSGFYFI